MRRLFATLVVLSVVIAVGTSAGARMPSATDRDIARAGVLELSDFPSGWGQSARAKTSDAELDALAAKIPACKAFLAFSRANRSNPRAKSPNFDQSESNVTNVVAVYPSVAKAVAAMRTFADKRLPACLDRLYNSVFKAQLADDDQVRKQIRSVATDIAPVANVRIGDEAVAYQGTVTVALKRAASQTFGIGVVSVRVRDAIVGYSYTAGGDISAALQPAIVASVARLQQAQSTS